MIRDGQSAARSVLRFALFALVLVSPLPFGSVQPGAVLTIEIWAACLGALALWVHLSRVYMPRSLQVSMHYGDRSTVVPIKL